MPGAPVAHPVGLLADDPSTPVTVMTLINSAHLNPCCPASPAPSIHSRPARSQLWAHAGDQVEEHGSSGSGLHYTHNRSAHLERAHLSLRLQADTSRKVRGA